MGDDATMGAALTAVAAATYEPAGAIPTGSFAPAEPSPEERERQCRIADGHW